MGTDFLSRRTVLKSLSIGAVAGSVLRVIPLEAAEFAHNIIESEKTEAKSGAYTPKFFDAHQYKTLQSLCESILPADADSGGAIEAGAPEFIDLLTSENAEYQATLGGWFEVARFILHHALWQGLPGIHTSATERDPRPDCLPQECGAGREFESRRWNSFLSCVTSPRMAFSPARSESRYLGYKGNTYLVEFPGCPPVPGV